MPGLGVDLYNRSKEAVVPRDCRLFEESRAELESSFFKILRRRNWATTDGEVGFDVTDKHRRNITNCTFTYDARVQRHAVKSEFSVRKNVGVRSSAPAGHWVRSPCCVSVTKTP